MTFPNDFSPFQELIKKLGKISEDFWVVPPDHISYFNKESMKNLVENIGYEVKYILADFPIDIFLFSLMGEYPDACVGFTG